MNKLENRKKPSRFMPKYRPQKANPFAIFISIVILVAILRSIVILANGVFLILLPIMMFVVIWAIENLRSDKYFESLYNSRKSLSIGDFAKEFDCKKVDTWIIRAVYEQIQNYLPYDKPIPIKGTDDLEEDLKIDEEDFEMDLVEEILQRTRRQLKNCEDNPYYGKINTVKDVVLFFNNQNKSDMT